MDDLITVVLPCYNADKYLKECIDSVRSQTYTNWELIIVDDCSSDKSQVIISEYLSIDSRIRALYLDKNSGSPVCPRNMGIENAKGKYIAFIDSDDKWYPQKLENQLYYFMNNNDCVIVYSNYYINNGGQKKAIYAPNSVDYLQLLKGNIIACSSAIYDTTKVQNVLFTPIGHEDFKFWLDLLRITTDKAYNSNQFDFEYRLVENSLSSNKLKAMLWHWNILYKTEGLTFVKSVYFFMCYLRKAILKRI